MNGRNRQDNRINVLMSLILSLLFTTALWGLKDGPKLFFLTVFVYLYQIWYYLVAKSVISWVWRCGQSCFIETDVLEWLDWWIYLEPFIELLLKSFLCLALARLCYST